MVMLEGHSGMYQGAALLSNELSKKHSVYAITPEGAWTEIFNPEVHVIKLCMGDTKSNFIQNTFKITNYLRFFKTVERIHPHVLHFHTSYNPWPCPLLPLLKRYPIVTSLPEGELHGGMIPGEDTRESMYNRNELRISRNIHVHFSDAVIVNAPHNKSLAQRYAPNKPIYVIRYAPLTLYTKYMAENIEETNTILFFGGIGPFKGVEYLLRSFPLVKRGVPSAKLTMACNGDIAPYNHVINQLKNNLAISDDDIIIDNRFIPFRDVTKHFQRAKVVVLPYVGIDYPNVAFLAYALKKPVVCTYMCKEEVGKRVGAALVVPPRDPQALAQAIIKVLTDDHLRESMKRRIEEKVMQELNWRTVAKSHMKVYEALTSSRRE